MARSRVVIDPYGSKSEELSAVWAKVQSYATDVGNNTYEMDNADCDRFCAELNPYGIKRRIEPVSAKTVTLGSR